MKYLPIVWAALRRHTAESLLTLLVFTVAFTLFSAMLALRAAYDHAIDANRMDRLMVSARFCCTGLNIARRAELERLPGVRGVAVLQGVFGFHQDQTLRVGVWSLDGATMAAIPELRLNPSDWKLLQDLHNGLLFTRTEAAKWHVKVGDPFPVQTNYSRREDGSLVWPFVVAGIVDNPATQVDWMPNIYASYDYLDASRVRDERGLVQYVVAIDNPDRATSLCRQIDSQYANSATPSYCVPLQMDARNMVASVITMRQMSLGIGAAGLFMILFLSANSLAESVRERIPEFAVLKTVGFGDREVAWLVLLEAAIPVVGGALLGLGLAAALASMTARLGAGSGLNLPPANISFGTAMIALLIALILSALSAVLPLRRLHRMQLGAALAAQ